MEAFRSFLKIAGYNAKIIFGWNLAAAIGICILSALLFDLHYLAFNDIAQIGELYLSILGILLLPGLGKIEEKTNSCEIIYGKMRSYLPIWILRFILSSVVVFSLIAGVILYARMNHGDFDFFAVTGGVFISALYLGLTGLTASNLQQEPSVGYIVSFGYYMFEYFSRGRYTSAFYVFSLLSHDYRPKYVLLAISSLLLLLNVIFLKYRHFRGTPLD